MARPDTSTAKLLSTTRRTTTGNLDFPQAYNPYYAYSDQYECPLIPMEKWLDVPIEVGEKAYEPPEGATSHANWARLDPF